MCAESIVVSYENKCTNAYSVKVSNIRMQQMVISGDEHTLQAIASDITG